MDFIDFSHVLYKKILETDFSKIKLTSVESFFKSVSLSTEEYSPEAFKGYYRKEIEKIINVKLSPILGSENKIKEIEENYFYDEGAPIYSVLYLFWIWHNNVNISNSDLNSLIQGVFMGTMGIRLIDMYTDDESSSKELFYLGNYLIRLYEKTFNNTLGLKNSYEIINFFGMKYLEVEYKEKYSLWKPCPFTWEEVHLLGYKTAPLIGIFQVLFKITGMDAVKCRENIDAFLYVLTANQLIDDVMDALSDLNTGRETLVMDGFYDKYEVNKTYTKEQVEEYLTQERLFKIHNVVKSLSNKANEILIKNREDVLLLFSEVMKVKILDRFEFERINH